MHTISITNNMNCKLNTLVTIIYFNSKTCTKHTLYKHAQVTITIKELSLKYNKHTNTKSLFTLNIQSHTMIHTYTHDSVS